jgi:secreted trypsin-like serine protease
VRGSGRSSAIWAALVASALVAGSAAAAQPPDAKRIVGGQPADPADWPWMAAVAGRGHPFCGGVVIAPKVVVTAAHCVLGGPGPRRVILGRPDLSDGQAGESIRVRRAVPHPAYRRRSNHDIGIIRLRRPTSAPAIELPTKAKDRRETKVGTPLRVAGWGSTRPNGGPTSKVLRETVENVVRARACARAFRNFRRPQEVCTRGNPIPGGGRTSSCYGDSGGPLVADLKSAPVLVGVVSYGGRRCGVRKPSVYARVADTLRFVRRAGGL